MILFYLYIISSLIISPFITYEKCLPKHLHIPIAISFASASRDFFHNKKYSRPVEILSFGKRNSLFTLYQSGEDLLLGIDFPGLLSPFAFHPKGFVYTIHELVN